MIRRAPYLHAYMTQNNDSLRQGVGKFAELLKRLDHASPYMQGLYFTAARGDKEELFDPLSVPSPDQLYRLDPKRDFDEIIAFMERMDLANLDGQSGYSMWGEREVDRTSRTNLNYAWGSGRSSQLIYRRWGGPDPQAGISLDHWISIIEHIITWERPLYLWCGDYKYWVDNYALYSPDRTPVGWFCWIPQVIDVRVVPSAWRVASLLDGTMIVSQPDYFNINNNAPAIDRANAAEYEMNEAGLLPLLNDLLGYGSRAR